ncbi:unnamed protein product [Linum trigynum]|uniref:Uncharacterized protein n=1 Tax=Linum trigynum TaxID=586398 RepID=A0AAV2G9A5_9ROSI
MKNFCKKNKLRRDIVAPSKSSSYFHAPTRHHPSCCHGFHGHDHHLHHEIHLPSQQSQVLQQKQELAADYWPFDR